MSNFSHTQLFHSNVLRSIFNQDRETYHQVVDRAYPPHAVENIFEKVSLEKLFAQSILMDAGSTVHVKNLLGGMRYHDDVKEWIVAGGSPLMATKHVTRNAEEVIPLLGYRQSISHSVALGGVLRGLEAPLRLEQWLLGADQEMIASSLVRGFMVGTLRFSSIGTTVPAVLFECFNEPSIRSRVCDFLSAFKGDAKGYGADSKMVSTAYTFSRLGHHDLVEAIQRSPRYEAVLEFPRAPAQSLISDAFSEGVESFEHALNFAESFLGIDKLNPLIDDQFAQSAQYFHGEAWDEAWSRIVPTATVRFQLLKEAGRLHQAVEWLKDVLPHASAFPEIPHDQKEAFVLEIQKSYRSQKQIFKVMGAEGKGTTLGWLLKSIGKQAVLDEYRNACIDTVRARVNEYGAGYSLIDSMLLEFDHKVLQEHDLLHPILDVLHHLYPEIWGKQTCEKPSGTEISQLVQLGRWVAKALVIEPSVEAGLKWLSILDQPAARKALLLTLPMESEMIQALSYQDRAIRFTDELGV
jgi:hypothetical protein